MRWIGAVVLLAALGCGGESRGPTSIVVVTIDTLRADHLGAYGYFRDTSPTFDALAEEGVLFEQAVTTMATTLPAHVSLWTGRYPVQTGITRNGLKLRRLREQDGGGGTRLFAEMLAEAGYATAAFVSASPVKRRTGIDLGFALFDEPEENVRRAPETTDRALAWLEQPPAEPFFLWIHWFDPHHPYDPPEPYASRFRGGAEQAEFLRARRLDPADAEVLANNDGYDGEIALVDDQLARLIARLRARGDWRDLALVVTADHGEALGEHGRVGHGEVYNEQLFIPLVMKLPEWTGLNGRSVRHLVTLPDVVPTLVAALDLPIAEDDRARLAGVDAFSRDARRERALAQHPVRRRPEMIEQYGDIERFALVRLDWKYAYNAGDRVDELYSMESDRHELENLVLRDREAAERLRDELLAEIARLSAGGSDFEVLEENAPEVLDELRALGYLE